MDKGCQTELRAELPSSVRTETVWAGEVTAFGMLEMQGKSPLWHNSICFYLFLPFIFHRALVAACCSSCLDLPLGFLGTGDAPPLVFGDAPLPLSGSVACFTHCDWGWEPAAPPGIGIPSFPQESSHVASAFWCAWGGEITPKPAELCDSAFCMILVQRNDLPLVFQGFPPPLQSHESLVEAVGSSRFRSIALGPCAGSTETCGVLCIHGSIFH